jgi:hypothetical protein
VPSVRLRTLGKVIFKIINHSLSSVRRGTLNNFFKTINPILCRVLVRGHSTKDVFAECRIQDTRQSIFFNLKKSLPSARSRTLGKDIEVNMSSPRSGHFSYRCRALALLFPAAHGHRRCRPLSLPPSPRPPPPVPPPSPRPPPSSPPPCPRHLPLHEPRRLASRPLKSSHGHHRRPGSIPGQGIWYNACILLVFTCTMLVFCIFSLLVLHYT